MWQDRIAFRNPANGIAGRGRRIGFYAAIAALIINNAQFVNYILAEGFSAELIINNLIYNVICVVIAVCSYINFHFKIAFGIGVSVILMHIWYNAMSAGFDGSASIIDLPVILFCPILMITFAGHRVLAALAFAQAGLLYYYIQNLGPLSFAKSWPQSQLDGFTSTVTTMSFLTILALAAVAFARERTDKRLFQMIRDKEKLAAEDSLTGLDNRRSFLDKLAKHIAQDTPLGCAFIDLDRFKPINDKYGHAIGDIVIKTIGERLSTTPGLISVARLGGDEFGLIIARNGPDVALEPLFETVHNQICQDIMTEVGNVAVGASVGYSVFPGDGNDVTELMHAADIAMRRTKAEQIGAVRFNIHVDSSRLARSAMEMSFKDALKNGDLRPALQPIACSRTGDILGYEMLARWVTDKFATTPSPVDFIPIAERFGLLNELLVVTLDQALSERDLESDKFLAVNVSPSQLSHPNFLTQIRTTLETYKVDPSTIELEVTEQVAFRNVEHNIKMLRQAQEMGMKISLDDFGTGYSSLAILDTLPLNKLKIDRSFLQRQNQAARRHDVLAATIDLAHRLNLSSCMEGVEDAETAARVASMGCDQLQGYWIGRPKLVKEMEPGGAKAIKRIA